MPDTKIIGSCRKVFAEVTGELEDAALMACRGQAARNRNDIRKLCGDLIGSLERTLGKLRRMRKHLR